jgi:hypothetical protein
LRVNLCCLRNDAVHVKDRGLKMILVHAG